MEAYLAANISCLSLGKDKSSRNSPSPLTESFASKAVAVYSLDDSRIPLEANDPADTLIVAAMFTATLKHILINFCTQKIKKSMITYLFKSILPETLQM